MTEDPTRVTFRNAATEAAERQATALERIAESLDTIAALLAAPAALRATGVQPVSPTTYKPDAHGWIEWQAPPSMANDASPVWLAGKMVEVRYRDGDTSDGYTAGQYDWRNTGADWNITHYRIVT